jgi:PAS domain S-box-containing protein
MPPSELQWQQQQRTLEVLSSLSYRTGELHPYLQAVARGVSELLGIDWSVVTLCQNGFDRVLASSLDMGAAANRAYELHGTLTGTVVERGCSLVVEDAQTNSEYGKAPEGYHAYLGVPLRSPLGKVIGTICSFHRQPRLFRAEEVQLAEIFAERAATAIDNYELFQKQVRLNTSLQESEERFRTLVENAADSFLLLDPDGKILDVNQHACDSLGYAREELLNLSIFDIEAKMKGQEIGAFRQQLPYGTTTSLESIHRRKDGTTFPIEARIRLFEFHGQKLELALVRDITERKQAERFRERLAEIGELAATIVHEVRNPLTTVLMGLTSFKSLELSDRYQMRLKLALEEADRLQRLLEEILLYAKKQHLQRAELELNAFLVEILESCFNLPCARGKRIEFTPFPTPVKILGDKDKLRQVIVNLLENACEAVTEGEAIAWQLESASPSGQVSLRARNGGAPIPPENLSELTKPFFTTKPTGNGLGLAIVKRIVEAHDGELSITSDAIAGTTVTVKLPIIAPPRVED